MNRLAYHRDKWIIKELHLMEVREEGQVAIVNHEMLFLLPEIMSRVYTQENLKAKLQRIYKEALIIFKEE